MIKCVIFDLDGVLTSTSNLHILSWRTALAKFGVSPTPDALEATRGVDRKQSLDLLLLAEGCELNDLERENIMALKNSLYLSYLDGLSESALFPGVKVRLAKCQSLGLQIGVASASQNAVKVLHRLGLLGMIDSIGSISKVRSKKPSPEIFHIVALRLGAKLTETICLEDSPSMLAELLKDGAYTIGVGPKARFSTCSTREVIPSLETWDVNASVENATR